jgi:hypothetical protein
MNSSRRRIFRFLRQSNLDLSWIVTSMFRLYSKVTLRFVLERQIRISHVFELFDL